MRAYGACGSKNVGTSNRNAAENAARRNVKVSLVMLISQGLVGPKGMAKAVLDGQEVNIPLLPHFLMERRRLVCPAYYWIYVISIKKADRQIRRPLFQVAIKCSGFGLGK